MQFSKETPTKKVKIQDLIFEVPAPFVEGHVCTKAESGVLNQTLAENTRNNMAKLLKSAVEDSSFEHNEFQAKIDEFLEEYEFGVRRGRGSADPIEREALIIARDLIRNALRRAGYKVADVDSQEITRLALEAIDENDNINIEAKRRVDQRQSIAAVDISSLNLEGGDGEEEEAA